MARQVPRVLSFEFDGKDVWGGVPVVNGHVAPLSSFDVHMDAGSAAVVTVSFPVEVLKLGIRDGALGMRLARETREALISLGWTPPEGTEELWRTSALSAGCRSVR